jgi:hypothetical protein
MTRISHQGLQYMLMEKLRKNRRMEKLLKQNLLNLGGK